jgi:hypothetical protein
MISRFFFSKLEKSDQIGKRCDVMTLTVKITVLVTPLKSILFHAIASGSLIVCAQVRTVYDYISLIVHVLCVDVCPAHCQLSYWVYYIPKLIYCSIYFLRYILSRTYQVL